MHSRLAWPLFVPVFLFLAACSSDGSGSSTATPSLSGTEAVASATPAATATPEPPALAALEPDGERIHAIVEELATGIGPRIAGTSTEKQAADLLAAKLESFGYRVEVQPFTVSREASRESQVELVTPENRTVASIPLTSSVTGTAAGSLVPSGIGRPGEFPSAVSGAIALIERGELTFQEKVDNAQAAGAAGVIIFNNQPGTFFGSLSSASAVPAVSISQAEGAALLQLARSATRIEIDVKDAPETTSYNVVATPPSGRCTTISGGHYDSVPAAPGANDNASGTATVVEIAAVLASQDRMRENCFVLFGAEEIGLLGSKAYVETLSAEQRQDIQLMLNFDMVGFGSEPWYLIGTPSMQDQAEDVAGMLGIETQRQSVASTGGGSDHASFMNAGIPAIFFYRANDPLWHQPGDIADRIDPALLEEAARMGIAMLEAIGAA